MKPACWFLFIFAVFSGNKEMGEVQEAFFYLDRTPGKIWTPEDTCAWKRLSVFKKAEENTEMMSSSPLYEVGKLRCFVLEGNLLEFNTANSLAGNSMIVRVPKPCIVSRTTKLKFLCWKLSKWLDFHENWISAIHCNHEWMRFVPVKINQIIKS